MTRYAIFHKESGRQITDYHENAGDMVAQARERHAITGELYAPQLKRGFERRAEPVGSLEVDSEGKAK